VDGRNLCFESVVDESMSRKGGFLGELWGYDQRGEGLAAAALRRGGGSLVLVWKWETGEGRRGRKDEPDISSISTCVACNFSINVAFRPSSVTSDSSAMVGRFRGLLARACSGVKIEGFFESC
jgi:hypothetical protein